MGGFVPKMFHKKGSESFSHEKEEPNSLFDFSVNDINGKLKQLKSYKGKVKCFIVVNVACKCGLTSTNYQQLVDIY